MRARTIDLGVRLVAACLVLVAACDDDYPRYRVDQSACRSVSSSYRWERDPISFDVYAGAPGQPDLCIHGMFSREWGRFLEGRVLDARLDDRPVDFRVFASDDVPLRLPNVARYLTAGRHSVSATVAGRFRAVSDVCDWRGCPSDDYDSTETRRVLIDAGWPLRFDQALQSVLAVPGHAQIVVEEKRDIFGIYDLESGDILTEAPAAVTVPAAYGFAIRPDDEYVVWWNGEQWLVRPIPARAAVLGLDGHGRVLSRRDGKLWIGNDRALAVALQPGAIAYPLKAGWMLGMPLSSTATTADLIELAPDGATRSIELTLGRSGLSDEAFDVHGRWNDWTMVIPGGRVLRRTPDQPETYAYAETSIELGTACRSAEWRLVGTWTSWMQVRRGEPLAGWHVAARDYDDYDPGPSCLPGFGWVHHKGPGWSADDQQHTYLFVPLGGLEGPPPMEIANADGKP